MEGNIGVAGTWMRYFAGVVYCPRLMMKVALEDQASRVKSSESRKKTFNETTIRSKSYKDATSKHHSLLWNDKAELHPRKRQTGGALER